MTNDTRKREPARPLGVDASAFMELDPNNLSSMVKPWLAIANNLGAIAAKQQEFAAATLGNMTEMMTGYWTLRQPQDAVALQVEFAKKTMVAAVATTREIAGVMGTSDAGVAQVVRQRVGTEGAKWLSDPTHRDTIVDLVVKELPPALAAVDKSGLPSFVGEQVRLELEQVKVLPLAAGLLSAIVEKGRHQQILDGLLDGLEKLVNDTHAVEAVRERIFAKLPSLFHLYRGEPIVLNRIIDATKALIIEIRADSAHPVRIELDSYLTGLIERLRSSSEFAGWLDAFKLDLIQRLEPDDLASGAWNTLRDLVVRDVNSEDSRIRRHLGAILAKIGAHWKVSAEKLDPAFNHKSVTM